MSQSFFQSSYRKTPYISSKFTLSRKFFWLSNRQGLFISKGLYMKQCLSTNELFCLTSVNGCFWTSWIPRNIIWIYIKLFRHLIIFISDPINICKTRGKQNILNSRIGRGEGVVPSPHTILQYFKNQISYAHEILTLCSWNLVVNIFQKDFFKFVFYAFAN